MRKPYLERLKDSVLLFDGAMGTMIYESGVFIDQCFENVNLTSPDTILNVHRKMAEAGAQALTTNSFLEDDTRTNLICYWSRNLAFGQLPKCAFSS